MLAVVNDVANTPPKQTNPIVHQLWDDGRSEVASPAAVNTRDMQQHEYRSHEGSISLVSLVVGTGWEACPPSGTNELPSCFDGVPLRKSQVRSCFPRYSFTTQRAKRSSPEKLNFLHNHIRIYTVIKIVQPFSRPSIIADSQHETG